MFIAIFYEKLFTKYCPKTRKTAKSIYKSISTSPISKCLITTITKTNKSHMTKLLLITELQGVLEVELNNPTERNRRLVSGQHYNQCDKATNKDQAREKEERERERNRGKRGLAQWF